MKDIFLCHTGADKQWVERLATSLEQVLVDGRRLEVFFDKWDIDYGENILTRIEEGLKQTRFLGVVLSPALVRAEWPRLEWQSAVHEDPTGRLGRILPLLVHKFDPETKEAIEIPLPLRLLRYYDFTDPGRFDREFEQLIRRLRGERPERGRPSTVVSPPSSPPSAYRRESPAPQDESLITNLLPVVQLPRSLFSDLTPLRHRGEVKEALEDRRAPPFFLHEQRLFCWHPADDRANPFAPVLSGTSRQVHRTTEWLDDPTRRPQLVGLLNETLRAHCRQLNIWQSPRRGAQFYCPTSPDRPRVFQWGPGQRPRTLAKVNVNQDGSSLGIHYAARMRFLALAERVYLLVEPGWMFTSDGVTPLEGLQVGVLSTKWGGHERNAGVLRNVLMWGLLLAGGEQRIRMECGAETLVLESLPAHVDLNVGVEGDTIRLDRVLSADASGEVVAEAGEAIDELDGIASLREAGFLEADEMPPIDAQETNDPNEGEPL